MNRAGRKARWILLTAALAATTTARSGAQTSSALQKQNERLFEELREVHKLNQAQMDAVRAIFSGSPVLGQGNPSITEHPLSEQECRDRLEASSKPVTDPAFEEICGGKFMAPLYDPQSQKPEEARACIDQFEFPDIPCVFPVVWVRASEAARLCEAVGKRLCDAHEWEGACQGRLESPDYRFDLVVPGAASESIRRMRFAHNRAHESEKRWSYGAAYQAGICAGSSHKSPTCDGGSWTKCGSNTFPAGSFPGCRSPLGVYDLNGNAAEHMNLPLEESQMASRGSTTYGYTEMKGSWFIFDEYRAHEDWCRWRAPFWHGSRVLDPDSHHNYHLSFRCCKTVGAK